MSKTVRNDFRALKVRTETHVRLKKLMERITQVGWGAIGSDRTTAATIADVADEALQMLDDKVTAAEKKRR
jgi:aminoglycoside N3'-acetyltransferase